MLVELTPPETEDYLVLSKQIAKKMHAKSDADDPSDGLLALLLKRARIVASAEEKLPKLLEVIEPFR